MSNQGRRQTGTSALSPRRRHTWWNVSGSILKPYHLGFTSLFPSLIESLTFTR
ncbi:hypothetical protein MA16_Dca008372 [Dendrobium catenatum]|uniref:Uncharacterized protein n=1 Tax=Dendrobium catenatum TaxID=906689 RepID=A0A2I0VM10_9ASPA|nr:hypothetical protein MA16_Dca008372 [Dendrobium catenatum]